MDIMQQNTVRLQDLNYTAGEKQSDEASVSAEKEQQKIKQEFSQINNKIEAFFAKIFPQIIDAICSLNKSITRKEKSLFFKNQEVKPVDLNYGNCLTACKEAMSAFPLTVNTMVSAIKNRAGVSYIEEIAQKVCREFNTVSTFQSNAERLLNDSIAHIYIKPVTTETVDYTENFSEVIKVPIGKVDGDEFVLDLDIGSPDAHAVITGITGSGKSSLLQSLILGGAYKYSPDRLQFWILDFKDGTGFIYFKALKHVKVMCINNRAIDSKEMMDYINKEYSRRSKLITESGGGDIRTYNRRAKANNLPLMPRLIIIIDEFVVMHKSCFPILNDIVIRGRSLGMGFIFSSQKIETHESYSNAIQQASHLFEFENFDGVFGRLVRDVTEKEKQFVDHKLHGKGNCLYRNNSKKILFRCAYAGDIDEQNEFIKEINAKWNNFPYREPIIAGNPERKIKSFTQLVCDAESVKSEFERTKKVFIPIGENSVGEPYLYKIDRDNPLLIAFGDETRVASAELSVMEHFRFLSDTEKAVYYIDLNKNMDRGMNAVKATYDNRIVDGVYYTDTDDGAQRTIDKVYDIFVERGKAKDIGNPIELIIHNAEHLSKLKEVQKSKPLFTRNNANITSVSGGNDLAADIAQKSRAINAVPKEEDIGTVNKLREIIEAGKDRRIYVMLYFEDKSRLNNGELFSYNNGGFKDVLVIPVIPDEYEELSYSEVTETLKSCGLRDQASFFEQTNEQTKLVKSDFICAVLVDDKVPHKIIPYEWSAEEN